MNISKLFNGWIASNFKGLSTTTLCQLIGIEYNFLPKDYISNMVYVDLYHVFTKSANDKERDTFDTVKNIIDSCAWV